MKCPNCKTEIDYVTVTHTAKSYATVDSHGLITDIVDYESSGGIIIIAICPECDHDLTNDIEDGEGFFGVQSPQG